MIIQSDTCTDTTVAKHSFWLVFEAKEEKTYLKFV